MYTIINWEKGITKPQTHQVAAVIQFLGYDPEPPNPKTIAEHLLAKRRKFGWTQRSAAKKLGVDPCSWSKWENGRRIMLHKHRRQIASFLDFSQADLQLKMNSEGKTS